MSHTNRRQHGNKLSRRISVRAVRRANPDSKRLSRALIAYALEQAAAEAAAQCDQQQSKDLTDD